MPESAPILGLVVYLICFPITVGPSVAFGAQKPSQAPRCKGVDVEPPSDIQSAIDGSPEGATLCIQAGEYRIETPLNPKNHQKLIAGGPGTILNGSKLIEGFVPSGANFVASGFLPKTPARNAPCIVAGCSIQQDVFFDGAPMKRVLNLKALTSGAIYEDFARNRIYLRDDPTGHKVEQAFASRIIQSGSSGVTVQGFIIEKAAVAAQFGAIDAAYASGSGWLIQNNEVWYNHGAGITAFPCHSQAGGSTCQAGGSTVQYNFVHHNGQEGVEECGSNMAVQNNEIAFNNTAGFDPGWEAGGAKFGCDSPTQIVNLTVLGNNVHDNQGPGLWCDANCYNVLIEKNTVDNNVFTDPSTGNQQGYGIFCEISDRCVIRYNTASGNGPGGTAPDLDGFYVGGQIVVAETPNSEIYGNTVAGVYGIGMLQQRRPDGCTFGGGATYPDGTPVCPNGSHSQHDTLVQDNTLVEPGAAIGNCCAEIAGLDTDTGDLSFFLSSNNRFVRNTYHLDEINGAYFTWLNLLLTKDQWVADGQDTTGIFLSP